MKAAATNLQLAIARFATIATKIIFLELLSIIAQVFILPQCGEDKFLLRSSFLELWRPSCVPERAFGCKEWPWWMATFETYMDFFRQVEKANLGIIRIRTLLSRNEDRGE